MLDSLVYRELLENFFLASLHRRLPLLPPSNGFGSPLYSDKTCSNYVRPAGTPILPLSLIYNLKPAYELRNTRYSWGYHEK